MKKHIAVALTVLCALCVEAASLEKEAAEVRRMFDGRDNFNEGGFLTIGFAGRQPDVADWYTNNGSLYMTSLAFLPLGLPAAHPFWTDAPQPWTSCKAWGGQPFPKDHHWKESDVYPDLF